MVRSLVLPASVVTALILGACNEGAPRKERKGAKTEASQNATPAPEQAQAKPPGSDALEGTALKGLPDGCEVNKDAKQQTCLACATKGKDFPARACFATGAAFKPETHCKHNDEAVSCDPALKGAKAVLLTLGSSPEEGFLKQVPLFAAVAKALVGERIKDAKAKALATAGIDFLAAKAKVIMLGQDQDKVAAGVVGLFTAQGITLDDAKKAVITKAVADSYAAIQTARKSGRFSVGPLAAVVASVVEGLDGKAITDPLLKAALDPKILGPLLDKLAAGDASADDIREALDELGAKAP